MIPVKQLNIARATSHPPCNCTGGLKNRYGEHDYEMHDAGSVWMLGHFLPMLMHRHCISLTIQCKTIYILWVCTLCFFLRVITNDKIDVTLFFCTRENYCIVLLGKKSGVVHALGNKGKCYINWVCSVENISITYISNGVISSGDFNCQNAVFQIFVILFTIPLSFGKKNNR